MSELALERTTEQVMTAASFHEQFLQDGIKYDDFECPFCGVELVEKNINKHERFILSPHFEARKEKHRFNCDGYPVDHKKKYVYPPEWESIREFMPKFMLFPEALIDFHPQLLPRAPKEVTEVVVRERREGKALKEVLTPVFRVRLLASIMEVHAKIYEAFDKLSVRRGLNFTDKKELRKNFLKKLPLSLPGGQKTNYYNGIVLTKYQNQGNRIYHGNGHAKAEGNTIIICPDVKLHLSTEPDIPADIRVIVPEGNMPELQAALVGKLNHYVSNGNSFKWAVLGTMNIVTNMDTKCDITVTNLNWVYL